MVAAAEGESRASERIELGLVCECVIQEQVAQEGFEFHQYVGKVLNMSREGMMVLMGIQPRIQQVIQVHLSHPRTGYTISQVQVLRTYPAEDGKNFVVGCKSVHRENFSRRKAGRPSPPYATDR